MTGCGTEKITYPTWADAERNARRVRRKAGGSVQPYRCRECGRIHVGNSLGGDVGRRIKRERLERIERRERLRERA